MKGHRCKWMALNWRQQGCNSPCRLRVRRSANYNPFPSLVLALHTLLQLPAFIVSLFMKREAAFLHGKKIKKKLPRGWRAAGRRGKNSSRCEKERCRVSCVCEDCDNVCMWTMNKRSHWSPSGPEETICAIWSISTGVQWHLSSLFKGQFSLKDSCHLISEEDTLLNTWSSQGQQQVETSWGYTHKICPIQI